MHRPRRLEHTRSDLIHLSCSLVSDGVQPLEIPPRKEEVGMQKEKTAEVTNDVPPSSGEAELGKASKTDDPPRKKASRVGDDDLPPMM